MMRRFIFVTALFLTACDGAGSGLRQHINCAGVQNIENTLPLAFSFHVYDFADTSAMVTCGVYDTEIELQNTAFFRGSDIQVVRGDCSVFYDIETNRGGGHWDFTINRQATTPAGVSGTVTYHSSGSTRNGLSFALSCSRD